MIPAVVPAILIGIRVALPLTIVLTLLVEILTSIDGIGALMIAAQRNFQANAQMITTADSITQTIINIR